MANQRTIYERLQADPLLRRELLSNPRAFVEAHLGKAIDPNTEIRVLDSTPSTPFRRVSYIMLPPVKIATLRASLMQDGDIEFSDENILLAGGSDSACSEACGGGGGGP